MKFSLIKKNLFSVLCDSSAPYFLAHCISSDCALGAGIAVEFQKRFRLREQLQRIPYRDRLPPSCVLIANVFNLITKEKCWAKPTYESFLKTLELMKAQVLAKKVHKLAMPKIGCGLDGLDWGLVQKEILDIFAEVDVEVTVCYL